MRLKSIFAPLAFLSVTLISGCATQNQANEIDSKLNNQQLQINALNVRLQYAENNIQRQEAKIGNDITSANNVCYLNGEKYSVGSRLYGKTCNASIGGAASWQ